MTREYAVGYQIAVVVIKRTPLLHLKIYKLYVFFFTLKLSPKVVKFRLTKMEIIVFFIFLNLTLEVVDHKKY